MFSFVPSETSNIKPSSVMSQNKSEHDNSTTVMKSVHNSVHNSIVDTFRKSAVLNRGDARYWTRAGKLFRYTRKVQGEAVSDATYSLKIAFQGKREQINTGEREKAAAASVAAEIYRTLDREGWQAVLERWKPAKLLRADTAKGINVAPTVGEFIAAVMKLADVGAVTLGNYCRSFRHIVADVAKIEKDNTRFDYVSGGAGRWRDKVDAVELASITPQKVQAWKIAFVAKAGGAPQAERSAKVSVNSSMRPAKSLFANKERRGQSGLLSMLQGVMRLPSPLPFDGVGFYEGQSMRYQSKIDAGALLTAGRDELALAQPEAFKVLVLSLCCGLRRNEIDKLTWRQVDLNKGVIRIETTRYFSAKSEDSLGEVDLDSDLVALLRGWKAKAKGEFVIEAAISPRLAKSYQHYRTERITEKLALWLKDKGVEDRKYLHTLRKEFGSLVPQEHGIYAASRALRHADIQVTAKHYLDKKQRISIGLGRLLRPDNVQAVDFAKAAKQSTAPKAKRAKAKQAG